MIPDELRSTVRLREVHFSGDFLGFEQIHAGDRQFMMKAVSRRWQTLSYASEDIMLIWPLRLETYFVPVSVREKLKGNN